MELIAIRVSGTGRTEKFQDAAFVYVAAGLVVVALTILFGLPAARGPEVRQALFGLLFFAAIGSLLYFTAPAHRSEGWLSKTATGVAMILTLSNGLRCLNFLINFFGWRAESHFGPLTLHLHPSEFSFNPVFLINATLMGAITYLLARAAWDL